MWCGSFDIITDENIAAQFAYHFCRIKCNSKRVIAAQNALLELANEFHLIGRGGGVDKLKHIYHHYEYIFKPSSSLII